MLHEPSEDDRNEELPRMSSPEDSEVFSQRPAVVALLLDPNGVILRNMPINTYVGQEGEGPQIFFKL